MTILQSLESYYRRLPDVPEPGWSREKFGWCIVIRQDGEVVDVENLHDLLGKKPKPKLYTVPAAVKRTAGIAPNFLWDKTAYVIGRSASEGKRTSQEHGAFVAMHLERLAEEKDEGLVALLQFLEKWTPEKFDASPFKPDILDANVMFRLEGDSCYLHMRPDVRALVSVGGPSDQSNDSIFCLISGARGPAASLHPTIKGVEGAQSSGAVLVSFNRDAFTSLGMKQGANAPVSEAAAFRYGTALNQLLAREGPNRLRRPVGDATVVFWADASNAAAAQLADAFMAQCLDSDISDEEEAAKIRRLLESVAAGRPLSEVRPGVEPGTQFHVLGLSPNASRLSVRFWLTDTLDAFVQRIARHHDDFRIDPLPPRWGAAPSINRLLVETTALQHEYKNIPPLLAGEVMRAVLSGTRYPLSLLSATLMRLRAGDSAASGWHAAAIRAVLVRLNRRNPLVPEKGETPMSLKRDHANAGYQLGRLFAVYEMAQRAALGRVNATIRDRYFGAASAAPASIFPLIVRGGQNHLSKVRKDKPGLAVLIERELEEINNRFEPDASGIWPRTLRLADQGEFAIGYYQQRSTKLKNEKGEEISADDLPEIIEYEGVE